MPEIRPLSGPLEGAGCCNNAVYPVAFATQLNLGETVVTIAEEIERLKSIDASKLNESTAKTTMVMPILRALGWDTTDPDEVKLEYKVAQHLKGFADIALLVQDSPLVLIETKSPQRSLETENHEAQVLEYCQMTGVRMGVLTNGLEWRVYYLETGADKSTSLAETINLAHWKTEDSAKKLTELLSRDAISDNRALTHAKQSWHHSILTNLWKGLLAQGDPALVRCLRKEVKEKCNINIPVNDVKNFVMARATLPATTEQTSPHSVPRQQGEKKVTPASPQQEKPLRKGKSNARIFGVEFRSVSNRAIIANFTLQACHNNEQELENLRQRLESDELRRVLMVHSTDSPTSIEDPTRIGETNYWLAAKLGKTGIKRACDRIKQALSLPEDVLVWLDD
ncbi:MAG: type I restriction endonuclease [Gammaproteobacteria bacterium]